MTDSTITLTADDKTAKALVDTIRAAVNADGKYLAYVAEHKVTRENVADHARALAVLTYPNDKPVQKVDGTRTRFGNAVQKAGKGLRDALGKAEGKPTDWLRLLAQAAVNAADKGGFTPDQIMATVVEAISATEAEAA